MSVSADTLRLHLEYSAWASQRLLDAAAQLAPEELTRDFKTAEKNVLGTLVHTFASDRLWLRRLHGDSQNKFVQPEDRDFAKLREAWPQVHRGWNAWAAPMTDPQAMAEVAYRDMSGNPHQQPVWQIVLHVVNHGTHHRGMVSGFLRSLGHAPPKLDLVAFYRSPPAAREVVEKSHVSGF